MDSALNLIAQSSLKQDLPTFRVGQTVRIHQRIKEGDKERIQVFEGIIIKKNNGTGVGATITVRKVVDGIGVERIFPIHSPHIAKIEITKQAKVRRSKLYYLRNRTGKSARLKTTLLEGQVFEPKSAADIAAAAEAEKAAQEAEKEAAKAEEATDAAPAEEAKGEETPAEEPAQEEAAEKKEAAPAEEAKGDEAPAEEPAKNEAAETAQEEAKKEASEDEKKEA